MMTIRSPEVPEQAVDLLRSTLQDITIGGRYRLQTLQDRRPEDISITQPHPVYDLGVSDIADGRGLAAAELSGWRFLLVEDGNAVAAGEILVDKQTGSSSFAGVNAGPYVVSTELALVDLSNRFDQQSQEWTPRVLRVASLYVWLMWLHDILGNAEWFLPLKPAPEYLVADHLYSWDELNNILMPHARDRLRDDFNRGNSTWSNTRKA